MTSGPSIDPLRIALLTLSDSRDEASDRSGALLASELTQAGHQIVDKVICGDDRWPSVVTADHLIDDLVTRLSELARQQRAGPIARFIAAV